MTTDLGVWTLAMNINTSDWHIWWYRFSSIDKWQDNDYEKWDLSTKFSKDYKKKNIWTEVSLNKILILNHESWEYQAWKSYLLKNSYKEKTLSWLFNNTSRSLVSNSFYNSYNINSTLDDIQNCSIMKWTWWLYFNWWYWNNWMRIMTEGQYDNALSAYDDSDDSDVWLWAALSMNNWKNTSWLKDTSDGDSLRNADVNWYWNHKHMWTDENYDWTKVWDADYAIFIK
jgi:hypothetical protein